MNYPHILRSFGSISASHLWKVFGHVPRIKANLCVVLNCISFRAERSVRWLRRRSGGWRHFLALASNFARRDRKSWFRSLNRQSSRVNSCVGIRELFPNVEWTLDGRRRTRT